MKMKKIGNCIYVHHTATPYLPPKEKDLLIKAMEYLPEGIWYTYTIAKVDLNNKKVSFIMSDNFDTAREPEVGDSYNVDVNAGTYKIIKSKGQIYHHKWMFIYGKYDGFDVEESKQWSQTWQSVLPNERTIKSRIGYMKYWNEYLKEYGLPIENSL